MVKKGLLDIIIQMQQETAPAARLMADLQQQYFQVSRESFKRMEPQRIFSLKIRELLITPSTILLSCFEACIHILLSTFVLLMAYNFE